MTNKEKLKKGYWKSLKKFKNKDGAKYGETLKQVIDIKNGVFLEYRIHINTNSLHIINVYEEGKGYAIFIQQ